MEDALAPTHRRVPEKPTVDGLEERWTARVGQGEDLPLQPRRHAERASTRSTRRRRRSRGRCTSDTSSATRTPTSSRGSGACAARTSSIRWAGTTTDCRPNAGSRTSTACAVTRRCPYDAKYRPPEKPGQGQGLHLAKELRRTVRRTDRASTKRPSRTCGAPSASASTGTTSTRRSPTRPRRSASAPSSRC